MRAILLFVSELSIGILLSPAIFDKVEREIFLPPWLHS